jgi:RND superfamily putative drug exporter
VLARLAGVTVRRRRRVLFVALLAFVASGAIGGGVADQLSSGGFDDPDAESTVVENVLLEEFDSGTPNVLLLVEARSGDVDDPAVAEAGVALAEELAAEQFDGLSMTQVLSYWALPAGNPLASDDGRQALVLARYPGNDSQLVEASGEWIDRYARDDPASPVAVRVGGFGPVFAEVNETIEGDLVRAEAIALPVTLVLLLLVFGSVVAALLPLAIGALSVVGTFVVLLVVNQFTEVSVFALNLTTAMGLGLAVDYSLFIVSRYREELGRGHEPPEAVRRTMATAGKTVLFSALTVAASLCALLVFDIAFLRSFAYAGLAVSVLAGVYAIVVLPAMLAALGHRIDALTLWRRSTRPTDEGFWHRMAVRVMRRPVPVALGVLAVLFFLGAPSLGMELGFPDDRVLPEGKTTRDAQDALRRDFSSEEAGAISVVVTGIGDPAARAAGVDAYARELARVPGVTRVDAESGIYCGSAGAVGGFTCTPGDPLPVDLSTLVDRFSRPTATYLSVVPDVEPLSGAGEDLARTVRDVENPLGGEHLVGGQSAQLVDAKASLFGDLPLALAIIAVITFVLLFLMFGSVVVPAKALVLNVLSLSATFGAMVWVFQEGNGSGLLGFTPTGTLTATIPVLMFCVAFGLSMDYEVFLLSRIKEEHDHGADNVGSVAVGLQRTGRIVTASALLMSVVFLAFATSEVSFIKLFGIGLTLAVLLDAFVIRGTLVPAFMRLAGEANWWAPGWMRRIYDRFGIHESDDLDKELEVLVGRGDVVLERPPRREPLRAAGR